MVDDDPHQMELRCSFEDKSIVALGFLTRLPLQGFFSILAKAVQICTLTHTKTPECIVAPFTYISSTEKIAAMFHSQNAKLTTHNNRV